MTKVITERRDHTLLVTINRPDVRNCVDGETAQGLFDAVELFKSDDALHVLVLTGAGDKAFCSGADLRAVDTLNNRPGARESGPIGVTRITDVHKPTIAAVEGYCTAGGLELACWCDMRIASRSARFGVLNRRWGVPLVDGGTQRLPRMVGMGNALYLIETGALIGAEHALRIGLAQEVVGEGRALERALEIAEALGSFPQLSMLADRRATLEGVTMPIDEGLVHEVRTHGAEGEAQAMIEGLRRFDTGDRPEPFQPADG